jgi:hypothetical protein
MACLAKNAAETACSRLEDAAKWLEQHPWEVAGTVVVIGGVVFIVVASGGGALILVPAAL